MKLWLWLLICQAVLASSMLGDQDSTDGEDNKNNNNNDDGDSYEEDFEWDDDSIYDVTTTTKAIEKVSLLEPKGPSTKENVRPAEPKEVIKVEEKKPRRNSEEKSEDEMSGDDSREVSREKSEDESQDQDFDFGLGFNKHKREEKRKPKKEEEKKHSLTKAQLKADREFLDENSSMALEEIEPNSEKILGKGGYGKVYLSQDGEYAIKVIRLENNVEEETTVEEVIHDTVHELDVMDQMGDYEEIVKYHGFKQATAPEDPEFDTTPQSIQIFMEALSGDTLDHFVPLVIHGHAYTDAEEKKKLRYTPLTPLQVIQFTRKILSALLHLHNTGILHGDLKPANIYLTNDGQLKLIDFGGAQIIGDSAFISDVVSAGYCPPAYEPKIGQETKQMIKTPAYDLYALGVIIRELLTGYKKPRNLNITDNLVIQLLAFSDYLLTAESAQEALDYFTAEFTNVAEDTQMPSNFK